MGTDAHCALSGWVVARRAAAKTRGNGCSISEPVIITIDDDGEVDGVPGVRMSIAILGAGILGACTALELADRGHRLTIFERNAEPLSEASLYNEGKLHLGFVYAADPSFRTAARMIRGAARFMDVLGRWIPHAALRDLPARPFDYVVHRDTMVTAAAIEAHFLRVRQTLEEVLPRQPAVSPLDPSRPIWRRLTGEELATRYDPSIIEAAYETCEIAVDPVGDRDGSARGTAGTSAHRTHHPCQGDHRGGSSGRWF